MIQKNSARIIPDSSLHLCSAFLRSFLTILILISFNINIARGHQDIATEIDIQTENIVLNESDSGHYFARAELHRRHMDWIAALADYDSAEQRGFSKVDLHFYRGRMYLEAERYTDALYHLDLYLKKRPDSPNALIVRAKIPTQDPIAAVKDLDHAIALLGKPIPELYLRRARLLLSDSSENLDQVLHGINEGLTRLGPIASLIDFGVMQCEKFEEYAKGLDLIDRLPENVKLQANWQVRIGKLYLELRDLDKAQEHYQSALEALQKLPGSRRNTVAMSKIEKEILTEFATYGW